MAVAMQLLDDTTTWRW